MAIAYPMTTIQNGYIIFFQMRHDILKGNTMYFVINQQVLKKDDHPTWNMTMNIKNNAMQMILNAVIRLPVTADVNNAIIRIHTQKRTSTLLTNSPILIISAGFFSGACGANSDAAAPTVTCSGATILASVVLCLLVFFSWMSCRKLAQNRIVNIVFKNRGPLGHLSQRTNPIWLIFTPPVCN